MTSDKPGSKTPRYVDLSEMARERDRALRKTRARRQAARQWAHADTGWIEGDEFLEVRNRVLELRSIGWSYTAMEELTKAAIRDTTLRGIVDRSTKKVHWSTRDAVLSIPVSLRVPDFLDDTLLVPPEGACRRLQAMMREGWRHQDIHARVGAVTRCILDRSSRRVHARTWRAIDAFFEETARLGPGPSRAAATYARNRGYQPALAWDDIDDPWETPKGAL